MHYMGYVFVNEATDEAVAAALEDHKDACLSGSHP